MKNNEDSFITDQEFIDFLSFDELGNMTDLSWNASSTTEMSHTCLNLFSNDHNDVKRYTNESMVILMNNLYQLEMEEKQVYIGPKGIYSILLETIQAKKLLRFMESKKILSHSLCITKLLEISFLIVQSN